MQIKFIDYAAGAALATDLVNASPLVRGAGDLLGEPVALARFLADHAVRVDAIGPDGEPTERDLEQVLALRQELRGVLEAEEDAAVAGAAALVGRAAGGPALYRDAVGRWQWCVATSPGASLAEEIGVLTGMGLLGALRTLGHDRFRHCASPVCEGMFVDTSRAGRRRYCMPELCGNRLNVANHRARRRASGPSGSASGS